MPWWAFAAALLAWSAGVMTVIVLNPGILLPALATAVAVVLSLVRRDMVFTISLALAALLLGAGRAAVSSPVTLPAGIGGSDVSLAGMVDDQPQSRRNGTRLSIRVDQLPGVQHRDLHNLRVQATVYGGIPVHYGDLVLLRGRIELPPTFDQFDYRAYLAEQGIAGVMASARVVRVTSHPGDPIHAGLFAIRQALVASVDRALPEPQAAIVLGVVFGYRAALPPPLEQAMIASGLIHIVVISGLKVSLLARILNGSLGRIMPRAAPVVALAAMLLYALLAGASAAALRAAAMGALVVIAGRLRRDTYVLVSLALTAAVMLLIKPGLARDVSFLLSFAGTAGIAGFTDGIARRLQFMPSLLRDPFAATLAAEAATWPLMLANFHQLSLVAPVANALVLPLLPLIMVIGGAGAIAAAMLAVAGWPALQLAGVVAAWFSLVVRFCGSLPVAASVMPYFPARWLAAASVVNGGALIGIKLRLYFWQRRVWAALGLTATLAAALLLISPDGRVHVYALDVGTGSAVVVRSGTGEQVLIDAGPDGDKFAQSIGRALPPTARELRAWIITGGRRLHVGASAAVLARFHVARIIVADPDPWTPTLRNLIQQAATAGIPITTGTPTVGLADVRLSPLGDGRSWVIQAANARLAVIPPGSPWHAFSPRLPAAIFTAGGPADWDPSPGPCLAIIQVASPSRDGLPAHALLNSLKTCQVLKADIRGIVEMVPGPTAFKPAGPG